MYKYSFHVYRLYRIVYKVLPYAFISFDSVLKKYPSKFVGCCLANPAEDGSGVKQLENLILKVFVTFYIMLIRFSLVPSRTYLDNILFYARIIFVLFASIHICGLLVSR